METDFGTLIAVLNTDIEEEREKKEVMSLERLYKAQEVVKIATPLGNMVVHLGLDNSGFAQKLTESSNSLKSFQRSIATYDRATPTSDTLYQACQWGGSFQGIR